MRNHRCTVNCCLQASLAQHCTDVDQVAFSMAENIRAQYLLKHPMPDEDALVRIQISTQAQMITDEIITAELIYK